jgi:CP family cyanate transporter-like MFS transporter
MAGQAENVFSPRAIAWLGVAGVLLLALSARTGVAALSPLAGDIDLDVPLDGIALGLLGMIPPIAYGIAGWLTRPLVRRVTVEKVAVAVALLAVVGHVLRGLSPTYSSLFVVTAVLMLAVGVTNVLLPALVKLYAPGRIGPVTSVYSLLMSVSTAAPALFGVWLADQVGWRWSLASWAAVSAIAVLPWLILLPSAKRRRSAERLALLEEPPIGREQSLWRSPTARTLALLFALSGFVAYSFFAVLPALLMETAAMTREEAGFALFVWSIMGVPMSLVIPLLAIRRAWPPRLVVAAGVIGGIGFLGLWFAPDVFPLGWVILTAMATLNFPLVLTLIADRSDTHHTAAQLSGLVNTVGYLLAATGPVIVGVLVSITGEWWPALAVLLAVVLINIAAYPVLRAGRTVDEELRAISAQKSK